MLYFKYCNKESYSKVPVYADIKLLKPFKRRRPEDKQLAL